MSKKSRAAKDAAKHTTTTTTTTPTTKQPTEDKRGIRLLQRAAAHVAQDQAAREAILALVPAKAAKQPAPPKEQQPTCPKTKKDGTACTARCVAGKQTCVDHQPAWERMTAEERVLFATWMEEHGPEAVVAELGWHAAKALVARVFADPSDRADALEQAS